MRNHQYCCAGADSPAYQLQPCTVLKQQHGKAVALVKLTPTDIITAGTDGRICHYHWRSNSPQPDTDYSQYRDRMSSATAEHSLPAAHQCSATISKYDSPNAAAESSGRSEGSERLGHGQSKGQSNGQSDEQSNRQSKGQSIGQSNEQSNGQRDMQGNEKGRAASSAGSEGNRSQRTGQSEEQHSRQHDRQGGEGAGTASIGGSDTARGQGNGESNRQSNGQSNGESGGQGNGQSNGQASSKRAGSSGQSMSLVCVAEERLPNITTVQDVVQIPGTKEQLVCGFQVLLLPSDASCQCCCLDLFFMKVSWVLMLPILLFSLCRQWNHC